MDEESRREGSLGPWYTYVSRWEKILATAVAANGLFLLYAAVISWPIPQWMATLAAIILLAAAYIPASVIYNGYRRRSSAAMDELAD